MEPMGKDLSERLLSTLKDFAASSAGPRYSFAVAKMASFSLGQGTARAMAMMPNTFLQAS